MAKTCHHNCLEELSAEHKKILGKLDELEKAITQPKIEKNKIKEFLDFTENFAEPHLQKEEKVLLPALEKKGIPRAKEILTKEELNSLGHQCEKIKLNLVLKE